MGVDGLLALDILSQDIQAVTCQEVAIFRLGTAMVTDIANGGSVVFGILLRPYKETYRSSK